MKRRNYMSLFADDMILYIKNPKGAINSQQTSSIYLVTLQGTNLIPKTIVVLTH